MGQHKYNPIAIAAKNGEIKPKEKSLSKSEHKKVFTNAIYKMLCDPFGGSPEYFRQHL